MLPIWLDAIIAEQSEELGKLISDTGLRGHNVRLAVEFGKPYEEIIRRANEEQTNLIIMTALEATLQTGCFRLDYLWSNSAGALPGARDSHVIGAPRAI